MSAPTEDQQLARILDLLKASPNLTTGNIASALGVDVKIARTYLEELWTKQKIGRLKPWGRPPLDPGKQELWHLSGGLRPKSERDSKPVEPVKVRAQDPLRIYHKG